MNLQKVIPSQIFELRLMMDGLLELNSFVKGKVRGLICQMSNKQKILLLYVLSKGILWKKSQATGKAMFLQLIGMFEPCKACALGKA